jgi:hypothetical protein
MRIYDYYDKLDFFDSYLERPEIHDGRIIIPMRDLGVFPDHPLNHSNTVLTLPKCRLFFDRVTRSERIIHEYADSPQINQFKSPRKVVDISVDYDSEESHEFYLEGRSDQPPSWVEWTIRCVSFSLEIE